MNLQEIEDEVNEHALEVAQKLKLQISSEQFKIHFVGASAYDTLFMGGDCVHIYTRISPFEKDFNTHLRNWLKVIPHLLHAGTLNGPVAKLRKLEHGKLQDIPEQEITEIVPLLLPKYRIQSRVLTKVILRDAITGIEEVVESGNLSIVDLEALALVRLSRKVEEIEGKRNDIEEEE